MPKDKSTGKKLADMMYGNPERAAFGVYPQAGKRGQAKPTAKQQLAQLFTDDRAMELPKLEDYDLSVPTMENMALSQRIAARQADLKRQADEAMSPLEKLAGGMQTGRLIGSGMLNMVKSIPTAVTKGGKAAEDYIAENIYKPNQPKAYEYAEDVGNFLQSLESDYKIPPVIPEAMVFQNLVGPATRQAKRGALQGGMRLERAMEPVVNRAMERGGLPREMVMAMGSNAQSNVIKPKGGNWLGGSIDKALAELKRPDRATGSRKDPAESMAEMKSTYTPEALATMSPETQAHVAVAMQDLERKIALNNWVDRNLSGYIKNEMATPEDPVRLMIDRRTAEIDQKFAKDMERVSRVEQRAAAEPDPRRRANFERQAQTDKAEAESERDIAMKYVSHMPENEIDYATQWIPEDLALNRMRAGFPTEGLGQSNTAKGWEAITDSYINSAPASEYTKPLTESETRRGLKSVVDDNPWLNKLDPDAPVQYLKNADAISQDLRLDHILDVLREDVASGRIRPEQLSKVSMEQAVRRTAEYDQEAARKMAEAQIKNMEGFPTYKEYPEGYRWVELAQPKDLPSGYKVAQDEATQSYQVFDQSGQPLSRMEFDTPEEAVSFFNKNFDKRLEEALKYEGDTMGHCVGGYCPDVLEGRSRIYSLRDAKGQPHVTVEAIPKPHPVSTSRRGDNFPEFSGFEYANQYSGESPYKPSKQQLQEIHDRAQKLWSTKGTGRASDVDQFYQQASNEILGPMPEKIKQIKGKQNARPIEKYDKYTQDFVRGGKWSDVEDLQNTGLFKLGDEYMTEAEAAAKYKPMTQEALDFLETHPAFEQHRAAERALNQFEGDMYSRQLRGDVYTPEYRALESAAGSPVSENVPYTIRELQALLTRPEEHTHRNGSIYEPISLAIEKLNQAKKELGIDLPPPEGMARGGRVHFSDNPDVMQLELAGGGLVKRLAKGVQNVLPAAEREANKAKFLEPSKVPQRLYHGTTATEGGKGQEAFRRIKPSKEGSLGSGVYLTPDSSRASGYAESPWDSKLNLDRHSPNVLPVHAQMRNPLILEGKGDPMIEALVKLGMDADSASRMVERAYEQKGYIGKQVQQRAQAAGYDGLLQYRDGDLSEVVSYNPNAVKSAIGNQGTYDINDPDLSKAAGGAIRMQVGGLAKLGTKGAAKGAKEAVKPSLVIKSKPGIIVSDLIDEDPEIAKRMGALARAKRQADIEAEGKRLELAKQTQPSVGYRKSTPLNPDPLIGTRFINEAPFGLNPNEPFDLSKFKGASGLVLPWDSQSRNVKTTQVSGVDLPNQIFRSTHGGVPYSFDTQHAAKGIIGASGEKIAERVKNRSDTAVRENKDRGGTGELLHFPITMGFRGEDYALPYSEFSFELINHKLMTGELTLKQAMELSNMVRNYTPPEKKYKGKKPFADFAGFTSPEGLDQIYTGQGIKAPSGDLRKAIADRIIWQKGSQEKLGFNAEDLMNATTYEPLRGVDKGFIGSSVMRNTPSGMRLSPSAGKYPYDTDFSGEHLGRLEDNVNAEALFYRTLNPVKRELMDRETLKPYTRESLSRAALAAIEKRNENVSQMIDQQFLDDYDTYITELRKPTEYKKGGAVRKYAEGGEITADDLILEERKL